MLKRFVLCGVVSILVAACSKSNEVAESPSLLNQAAKLGEEAGCPFSASLLNISGAVDLETVLKNSGNWKVTEVEAETAMVTKDGEKAAEQTFIYPKMEDGTRKAQMVGGCAKGAKLTLGLEMPSDFETPSGIMDSVIQVKTSPTLFGFNERTASFKKLTPARSLKNSSLEDGSSTVGEWFAPDSDTIISRIIIYKETPEGRFAFCTRATYKKE